MPYIAEKAVASGKNHAVAKTQYTRLLTGFSPVAIENSAEHGRALKAVAALMDKENRSRAEVSLLKLLAVLIEDYEQKRYSMGDASPLDSLKELMCARGMQAKDLWQVFGSKGITSEVLNGKRGISNEMARKLGELFSVSPAVFIWIHPMESEIDRVEGQKRDIDAGVSSRLAPGYSVETILTNFGLSVRLFFNNRPVPNGTTRLKRVACTERADRIVGAIIHWLSADLPDSVAS